MLIKCEEDMEEDHVDKKICTRLWGRAPSARDLRSARDSNLFEVIHSMKIWTAGYDRDLAMELHELFQLGFQIRITSNANQAWLDMAMKHFLPTTNELLKDHPSYPQSVANPNRSRRKNKFIAHSNIVKEYVEYMRSKGQLRGLLMAVGDQAYDVRPVQTLMKDKRWLKTKSSRTLHGYTILTRTDSNGRRTIVETMVPHVREMRAVLATIRSIYDIHNNRRAWEQHMKNLKQIVFDGQSTLDKALQEQLWASIERNRHCVFWINVVLRNKVRQKRQQTFDNTVTNLQNTQTKVDLCGETCWQLKLQHWKNVKDLNLHCRFVLYCDYRTRIVRGDEGVDQIVLVPEIRGAWPTFEETLPRIENLKLCDEPALRPTPALPPLTPPR